MMTEDQIKEMENFLRQIESEEDDYLARLIAERAFKAGFELAHKPLALDRATDNLDFLLKSGFFAPKKK